MRKWILDIHMYVGLLCSGYMIVYGLSTISFNHPQWSWLQPNTSEVRWQRLLEVTAVGDRKTTAIAVRDALGLKGVVPSRRLGTTDNGLLRFQVWRPAKHYRITFDPNAKRAEVTETRRGLLGAVRSLHGFTWPKDNKWTWASTFALYTELSVWALVLSIGSGVYLWFRLPSVKTKSGALLGVSSGTGLLLMIYLVW